MKSAKKILKELFHALGLEISRYRPDMNSMEANPLGSNPLTDIRRLTHSHPTIVFDVGANTGQSVMLFKESMPKCEIHAFEPSPSTYRLLAKNARSYSNVSVNNLAVGSSCGQETFLENSYPNMRDLPAFDEVYRFLLDRNFKLFSFYQFYYQQEMASWSDALFLSTKFDSSKCLTTASGDRADR